MPRFSIIIPYYNEEKKLIDRCINSITDQNFEDFEIIIIDDGSDSKHKNILKQLQNDKKIFVYCQDNQGVSSARNYGIQLAQGDYVILVDADDYLTNFCLNEADKLIENYNPDFIIGGSCESSTQCKEVRQLDSPEISLYKSSDIKKYKPNMINGRDVFETGYIHSGTAGHFIKKDIAKKVNYDLGIKRCEDMLWNLNVIKYCASLCVIKQVWYVIYENPYSVTRKYDNMVFDQYTEALKIMRDRIDLTSDTEFKAYCDRIYGNITMGYRLFLGNKQCDYTLSKRAKTLGILSKNEWWGSLGSKRYRLLASRKEAVRSLLFKYRLLFILMDIKFRKP